MKAALADKDGTISRLADEAARLRARDAGRDALVGALRSRVAELESMPACHDNPNSPPSGNTLSRQQEKAARRMAIRDGTAVRKKPGGR